MANVMSWVLREKERKWVFFWRKLGSSKQEKWLKRKKIADFGRFQAFSKADQNYLSKVRGWI